MSARILGALLAVASALTSGCATSKSAADCGCKVPPAAHRESAKGGEVLPFIADDYPRALAEAKRTGRPIFVDAWAPWCHSCLSLRSYVLNDPSLAPLADQFVWLAIDTEKDENAAFVARYTHAVLPTLWIIDPASETPTMKWAGGATADELRSLLGAVRANDSGDSAMAFVHANRAVAAGQLDDAERGYRTAVTGASKAARPRIIEALVTTLQSEKKEAVCADVAVAQAPLLPPGTSRANVILVGLDCAHESGKKEPEEALLAMATADATARDDRLLADDRSGLFEAVVDLYKDRGEKEEARAIAARWATFLEAEAARAPDPRGRAVFDPHRLGAYLALGQPERAVPMLLQSEADLPGDYNPPIRLARAYLEQGKLDEADAAADRAIARSYGPRAMRVFEVKADIAKKRGDRRSEREALGAAIARTEHAQLTVGQQKLRAGLAKRLENTP